jgi:hypothetical protein
MRKCHEEDLVAVLVAREFAEDFRTEMDERKQPRPLLRFYEDEMTGDVNDTPEVAVL